MELLKRLFKKLGRQSEEKETKSKTIRLSTTIAVHDLEFKKRKAIDYLKQHANLKFYMKVNIYDEENIQKGRLMLMNIAEDLKEYAKIKVSPMQEAKAPEEKKAAGGKKPTDIEDIKKSAEAQRLKKGEMLNVEDEDEDEDFEGKSNYIFMELQSTVAFKEIDIDKMLQHTSLDDFLRGLYVKAVAPSTRHVQSEHDKIMSQLLETKVEPDQRATLQAPELRFEDESKNLEMFRGENLRRMALQNLKERRQRQKQSEIFSQQEAKRKEEEGEEVAKVA